MKELKYNKFKNNLEDENLGIYIHIPFCKQRCYYCDFVTFSDKDDLIDRYIENLLKEINIYGNNKDIIDTIFIGGGTPSYIEGKYIKKIMEELYKNFNIEKNSEITIEANPGTLDKEKLEIYFSSGINRISMGVQSLNNNILKKIGRIHTAEEFYNNYALAREVGFKNINIDLMFDLPDQTREILIPTIEKTIELNPEHISFYSLILEEGTKLHKDYNENKLNLLDEDEEREMYHYGIKLLKEAGYEQYEISNFAKNNNFSKHNIKYWEIVPYLGLGLNSHSLYKGKRYNNFNNFKDYFSKLEKNILPIEELNILEREDEVLEYIIMKLRMIEGINLEFFKNRFNIEMEKEYEEIINKNIKNELIEIKNGFLRFTNRGLDISNQVYLDFMS